MGKLLKEPELRAFDMRREGRSYDYIFEHTGIDKATYEKLFTRLEKLGERYRGSSVYRALWDADKARAFDIYHWLLHKYCIQDRLLQTWRLEEYTWHDISREYTQDKHFNRLNSLKRALEHLGFCCDDDIYNKLLELGYSKAGATRVVNVLWTEMRIEKLDELYLATDDEMCEHSFTDYMTDAVNKLKEEMDSEHS